MKTATKTSNEGTAVNCKQIEDAMKIDRKKVLDSEACWKKPSNSKLKSAFSWNFREHLIFGNFATADIMF
jgi:hypothetical protein